MPQIRKLITLWLALLVFAPASSAPAQISCIIPPPQDDESFRTLVREKIKLRPDRLVREPATSVRLVQGIWNIPVLLIDFPDYRWTSTGDSNFANPEGIYQPRHFRDLLFSERSYADPLSGSVYTGSMRDFYDDNSYGRFEVDGDVVGWLTAANAKGYYVNGDGQPGTGDDFGFGTYPHNSERMVEEAVELANGELDFSRYDRDSDGSVDAVIVVHAGPGAEAFSRQNPARYGYQWSHFGSTRPLAVDNVKVGRYLVVPEDGAVGVFCHEFGHALGLPDLYDADGSSEGIGEWCLMSSGSWCFKSGDRIGTCPSILSAWCRQWLGWATALGWQEGELERLPPAETSDQVIMIRNALLPDGEYFLLENRQPVGFDAGLTRRQTEFGLPPPRGLMIYHVDEGFGNPANDRRRLVDVEEATPYVDGDRVIEQLDLPREAQLSLYLDHGNRGDNGDPFPGYSSLTSELSDFLEPRNSDRFDDFTTPAARSNRGELTGIVVSDIELDDEDVMLRLQSRTATAVGSDDRLVPETFRIEVSPNPASDRARISGRLPESGAAFTLRIFDLTGRERELRRGFSHADGRFSEEWSPAASLASGPYFILLETRRGRATSTLLLIR